MNSLLLCNRVLEIVLLIIMIVLGWMLSVGFACYMGTFPEFVVRSDLACYKTQKLKIYVYWRVWMKWGFM